MTLAALIDGLDAYAFAGVAIAQGDRVCYYVRAGKGIMADETTMFRVASISKIIVGGLVDPALMHQDIDPALRHPDYPDVPITWAMVTSHAASLRDDAGYFVPAGQSLADWIAGQGRAIWSDARPGTQQTYSNLGYIVLATALERAGRFDHMASAHLRHIGVTGGFNWSGVPPKVRVNRIATFRRDGAEFAPQIDADIDPDGVIDANGRARDLDGYCNGDNAGLFSPQGGLRINLTGMLAIARSLKARDLPVLWSPEMGAMETLGGLMDQYGPGVQILRDAPFYPRPLVGHFASAYGFKGGVWRDGAQDRAFAYALNGAAMGDESDLLSDVEHDIFSAISELE